MKTVKASKKQVTITPSPVAASVAIAQVTASVQPIAPIQGNSVLLPKETVFDGTPEDTKALLSRYFTFRAQMNEAKSQMDKYRKALNLPEFAGQNQTVPVYVAEKGGPKHIANIQVQFRQGYSVPAGWNNILKQA